MVREVKIRWDAFGLNFYAWGLVHYNGHFDDMALCGAISVVITEQLNPQGWRHRG